VRAAFHAACTHAGFKRRIVLEARALPMVAQLASLGLGVGVLHSLAAPSSHPAVKVIPIGRRQRRSHLRLVWNMTTATSPATRVLIDHTRAVTRPGVHDSRARHPWPRQLMVMQLTTE